VVADSLLTLSAILSECMRHNINYNNNNLLDILNSRADFLSVDYRLWN